MNAPTRLRAAWRLAALPLLALGAAGCSSLPFLGGGGSDPVEMAPVDRQTEMAALQQRAITEPENASILHRLAELQLAENDPVAAESSLRFALQRDAHHAGALSLLSKIFWDTGRHDEAVTLLESARQSAGALPAELMTALALHYDAIDRPDLADSIAREIRGDADWKRDGAALTYLRLRGDEYATSLDLAERARDAEPKSAVNRNNYGIALLYAGQPEAAEKEFRTAVELDSKLPGPLYNLAILERFYRFDEGAARGWFTKYQRLSSDDPDGLAEILAVEMADVPADASPAENSQ